MMLYGMAVIFEKGPIPAINYIDFGRPVSGPQRYNRNASPLTTLSPQAFQERLRDHPTQVEVTNRALEMHLDAAEGVPTYALKESQRLQAEVILFQRGLNGEEIQKTMDAIAQRYVRADILTLEGSMEEKAAARFAQFERVQVATDADGTLTEEPNTYLEMLIPGSRPAEKMLKEQGRENFHLVFPLTWQHGLRTTPGQYRIGGTQAPLRKGVREFFAYTQEKGIDVDVVTANMGHFVAGILDQIDTAPDELNLWAISENSILATDKATVIKNIAVQNPDGAVVFIGDGTTDLPALDAAPIVAVYFALRGSSFAGQLKTLAEQGKVVYFEYDTFHDVKKKLQEVCPEKSQRVN